MDVALDLQIKEEKEILDLLYHNKSEKSAVDYFNGNESKASKQEIQAKVEASTRNYPVLLALASQVASGRRTLKEAVNAFDHIVTYPKIMESPPWKVFSNGFGSHQLFKACQDILAETKAEHHILLGGEQDIWTRYRDISDVPVKYTRDGESQPTSKSVINDMESTIFEAWDQFRVANPESPNLTELVKNGSMTKETAISVIAATMLLAKNRKSSESTISNRDQDEALDLGGKTINKESVDMAELKEKALSTVKDDLKEIALRTGVKRTRALLASKVAEFWAKKAVQRKAGESDSEFYARAEQSREGFSAFLLSDAGQSVLAYMVGFAWPMLENQIPDPKVREYGAMVAREIRIQGGTDLLDGFLTEVAFPLLNVLKEEALGFGNQATNAITEIATNATPQVRVVDDRDKKIAELEAALAKTKDHAPEVAVETVGTSTHGHKAAHH